MSKNQKNIGQRSYIYDYKFQVKECNCSCIINVTFGLQSERLKFEKQPSHTIVRGALAIISSPFLVLYCTPLTIPFSVMREVTVPCSSFTL